MPNKYLELCKICKKRPIHIFKRKLCLMCYQRERKKVGRFSSIDSLLLTPRIIKKHDENREMNFIKNFFTHNNWIHHPASFSLDNILTKYTPDFYDGERNVFIEVSGSRQAYHLNKKKYDLFREIFPKINFEIRQPSGKIVNEKNNDKQWE